MNHTTVEVKAIMDETQQEIYKLKEGQAVLTVRLKQIEDKLDEMITLLKGNDVTYTRKAECDLINRDFNTRLNKVEADLCKHQEHGNKRNSDFIYWLITFVVAGVIGFFIKGA